ncbi:hypothetical protein LOZ58_004131 [Ophidiomyces ophidiicola]|nr:hypothetical protein LOZ65_002560 [Ophidiomyces ophidiicola]KAI1939440.1 hypothetical protein LOZ66_002752 [Ophidiomyces ophidiicola]KAI1960408.1 hypothetical protein LOZ58_004131 [Ophidiomyces ophidiicola]
MTRHLSESPIIPEHFGYSDTDQFQYQFYFNTMEERSHGLACMGAQFSAAEPDATDEPDQDCLAEVVPAMASLAITKHRKDKKRRRKRRSSRNKRSVQGDSAGKQPKLQPPGGSVASRQGVASKNESPKGTAAGRSDALQILSPPHTTSGPGAAALATGPASCDVAAWVGLGEAQRRAPDRPEQG